RLVAGQLDRAGDGAARDVRRQRVEDRTQLHGHGVAPGWSCRGLYRSTFALRPLMSVFCSALITSSTAESGISTIENLWVISMAPIWRPDRLDSFAMAPTRSCGRILAECP